MSAKEFKHDPKAEEWVDPYPKKKRKIGWFTGTILLLAFYVLATGPLLLLNAKGVIPERLVYKFCLPLDSVRQHSRTCDTALGWYWSFWIKPE